MSIDTICTIIATVVSVGGGVWYLSSQITRSSVRLDEVDKRTQKHEDKHDKHAERVNKNCEDIATLKERVHYHDRDIRIHTGEIEILRNKVMAQKASPLKLTEQGQKLFDDVDGAGVIRRHKQTLIDYIKATKPRSRLDVEAQASKAVYSLIDTDDFVHIKEYLYDAPEVPTQLGGTASISLIDVCGVIGLVLRDIYLEEVGIPPLPPLPED